VTAFAYIESSLPDGVLRSHGFRIPKWSPIDFWLPRLARRLTEAVAVTDLLSNLRALWQEALYGLSELTYRRLR
jgi:hypothetical protein